MKITEVTIFTVNTRKPPRAFTPVVVRIQTDEAISGIGEVGLAYGVGAIAGANMVAELTEGFLLGENPLDVERIWDSMFRRSFWGQGGGPIVMGAISAIDIALWDIKGKAAGLPIYAMLGGPCRDRLRMYANGWYDGLRSSEEYAEKALSVVADGYGALKLDPFMFSAEGDLDMPGQILDPARATLGYERVRAMRKAVGPDVDILIDAHGNMGVASAIIVGKRLEELNPFFYEEPVATMNVDTMKKVAEKVSIPLAGGERLYTPKCRNVGR
jgi:galactonate dehydratase